MRARGRLIHFPRHEFQKGLILAAGAVAILGMVAYFAGVVRAPITAFVIVMEMTITRP